MQIAAFAGRLDFFKRHFLLALPYLTILKVTNLFLNELEFRLAKTRLKSLPPFIKIESTPLCHLACAGCVHSDSAFKKSLGNDRHLSLERVRAIVRPMKSYLIGASLSYSGEPLLNKKLFPIVEHLHSQGIYTSFPTNLSLPISAEFAETIVKSGLDLMMVSLDGASDETYRLFRIGGNYQLVRKNVKLLADTKKRLGKKRPYLLWKFIMFSHNLHEIPDAKRNVRAWGFDGIEFDVDHDSDAGLHEQVTTSTSVQHDLVTPKPCYWAWNTSTITWDGDVQPCCKQMGEISLGDVAAGFSTVWNADPYQNLRASFSKTSSELNETCKRCMGFAD